MYFNSLTEWLNWQATLHPCEIDLGLTRCHAVAKTLNLLTPAFPIISVAGTNGKGSSVALLATIFAAAGYKVGHYTSPHLLSYNERICINHIKVTDAQLCEAFTEIETARHQISLTYFEFGTLAAMWLFQRHQVEIAILEVGLGGRLDAVNVFDPTVALITAIGIDHVEWLGKDRESIGFEKAGIFRPHRPAVCSDIEPPRRLVHHAHQSAVPLYCLGRDFHYQSSDSTHWSWQSATKRYAQLPVPHLLGEHQLQNAAGVLMAIELSPLTVNDAAVIEGLKTVTLPGRFQVIPAEITRIFDVAHNPLGAQILSRSLSQFPCQGHYHAVIGILQDKDIAGILTPFKESMSSWHVAELNTARSASAALVTVHLQMLGITQISSYSSISIAYQHALQQARSGDCVVVFGSFYTVAEALQTEGHCH
jgi:dihydrofolate synthase/folylpolyglutamate synthase